jgi:hypothetical protein
LTSTLDGIVATFAPRRRGVLHTPHLAHHAVAGRRALVNRSTEPVFQRQSIRQDKSNAAILPARSDWRQIPFTTRISAGSACEKLKIITGNFNVFMALLF